MPATSSARRPAQLTTTRARRRSPPAVSSSSPRARGCSAVTRLPRPQLGAEVLRCAHQRAGVEPPGRSRTRPAPSSEPSSVQLHRHAVAGGAGRQPCRGRSLLVVARRAEEHPQRRTGMPSASSTGSRSSAERRMSSVSSSPGRGVEARCGRSRSWCRSRPGRARARPRAPSRVAPRRASASATAAPTTPAPTTPTSASTRRPYGPGWEVATMRRKCLDFVPVVTLGWPPQKAG